MKFFGFEVMRSQSTVQEQLATRLAGLRTELAERYLEAIDLSSKYVDPSDALRGPDGEPWIPVGGALDGQSPTDVSNFTTETDLTAARDYCRKLSRKNPFAINLHENMISFMVGEGHKYNMVAKQVQEVPDERLAALQEVLESLLEENQWCKRQAEIVLRLDRDGEAFIRKFVDGDGMTRYRFVEPYRIRQPEANSRATFGIETDPDDVETVLAYWIAPLKDGGSWERVDASEIQHRKANVDMNVKRGVPTTWPIGPVLERVGRLMDNMGTIAEIQTAIAMIRRHMGVTKAGLENMRASKASYSATSSETGQTQYWERRRKGQIIDASANTEYDFPPSPDVTGWIEGASFNLRGAASRVCFPEFMFTSDASNANYASTMVAEGPAVRMFQRRQASMKESDHELLWEALERLVGESGLEGVELQAEAPTVEVRDEKAEADTNKIYLDMGILSKQTISASINVDYKQEQANIEQHEQDHPDQMRQAELAVMQANAAVDPMAANQTARKEAMEAYYGGGWTARL